MKIIIWITILIIVLLSIIGGGYFYYQKYILHGKPLNPRDVPVSDGYHYDNATKEKTIAFWNPNGNFQITLTTLPSKEVASASFEAKAKIYSEGASLNNFVFTRKETRRPEFTVKMQGEAKLVAIQFDNRVLEAGSGDRTMEEVEKFAKWFITYWANEF